MRFREWKNETIQAMKSASSEPNSASSPEWYAGLAVSPSAFSQQLGNMQLSLIRENQSLRGTNGERVAVRQRRSA